MASIDNIVSVTIDAQTTTPTQAGFGTPLIAAFHTRYAPERVREYASLTELLSDGFVTTDSVYRAANAVFAQNPRPRTVLVGRLTTGSVKTMDLTPVVKNSHIYNVTINGVVCSFTSDGTALASEIVNGLVTAINTAVGSAVTASNVSDVLRVVGDVAGVQFTLEADYGDFSQQNNTPDTSGIAAQIAAIRLERDDWYALIMDSQGELETLAAAAAIEATGSKVMIACSGNSDMLTGVTTDVASDLKAAGYDRTAIIFSRRPDSYPNAAWVGRVLPDIPGSSTWKFKTLASITVDSFTTTERNNLSFKNANFYEQVAGINITAEGEMASGEFIDVTIFIDWLKARIQESIFGIKANLKKVPFTDQGIGLIEGAIRGRLSEGITNGGLIAGTDQVIVPRASDVSDADRAARRLTGITFQAQLAGAVHSTVIAGTVTV